MLERLRSIKPVVLSFVSGLAAGVAGVVYLILRIRHAKAESIEDPDGHGSRIDAEKQVHRNEANRQKTRDQRRQEAEDLRRRILTGGLVLLFLLSAAKAKATSGTPAIPGDYATLKEHYLAVWELSERYRALYQEAETSVQTLEASNDRLLKMVEEQQAEIRALRAEVASLRARTPKFGLTGGASLSSGGPGLFLGAIISW